MEPFYHRERPTEFLHPIQLEKIATNFSVEEQELLNALDEIHPSGIPEVDGRLLDEITNRGRLARLHSDPSSSLRLFVSFRHDYRKWIATDKNSSGDSLSEFEKEYFSKQISVLSSLLEAYNISAQSIQEYDDTVVRTEGSESTMRRHALELFTPSGIQRNDMIMFLCLTRDSSSVKRLLEGADPKVLVEEARAFRELCLAQGIQPQYSAEARYWLKELIPLELTVLEKIKATP